MLRSSIPFLWLAATCAVPRAQAPAAPIDPSVFVRLSCAKCHGADEPEADLDLVALAARGFPSPDDAGDWLAVRDVLETGEMPPEDEPQPPTAERARMAQWVTDAIARLERAGPIDPGRVTMRRLSRVEYRNTVRDLLGVDFDPSDFPAEDLGYGFDNVGDALSLSTLHLEKYAAAAGRIAELAFPDPEPDPPPARHQEGEFAESTTARLGGDTAVLLSRGTVTWHYDLPRAGRYRVHIRAFGSQAGDEPARMALHVAGRDLGTLDVPATRTEPGDYTADLDLDGGPVAVEATFVNDYYRPEDPDPNNRDRNLYLDWCELAGPLDHREPTWAAERLTRLDPGTGTPMARACAMLPDLLERAWRRPADRGEITRLARLVHDAVDGGETFAAGIRWAIQAMLVSPDFLFRIEPGGVADDSGHAEPLDGFALATRLSYFLWSSMPDDRLFALARSGELTDLTVLVTEARRMLRAPRAKALADNFATQWLELRRLDDVQRDPGKFPEFTHELARDMRTETVLFFDAVLTERLSLFTLLDADFTFLNERLARHYGIPDVHGPRFRRVELHDPRRGGILTQGSILTVTSIATRTSPVRRGKWILENVLDDPPPPPPPGTASLAQESRVDSAASMREQLAQHRADPKCAACHDRMDAYGFTLENYDATGRWRDADAGGPIDASGTLPSGRHLDGPLALESTLRHERAFVRTLARKLFVFGIGRAPDTPDDLLAIERLLRDLPTEPTIDDVVLGIVELEAFRRRRTAE